MTDETKNPPEEKEKEASLPQSAEGKDPEKAAGENPPAKSPLAQAVTEIVEPFKGLAHTSRSLWGLYISYVLEGMVYFGILTIFGKYLSENVGLSDMHAGWVYSFFTGGITLAMLFMGGVADKIGVRKALLISLGLMILGRISFAVSGTFFPGGGGFGSMMFLFIAVGILFVVLGYGMYQPASYSGVKQFTNEKNAPMAFAMIYGLMNLGAFLSGLLSPVVRNAMSIQAVYWVYAGSSVLAFLCVLFIMSSRAVARDTVTDISIKKAKNEDGSDRQEEPAAPLFTPAFILSGVVVVAALGYVFYLMFTTPPGPIDAPINEYGKFMGEAAGLVAPADASKPDQKPASPEEVAAKIEKLEGRIQPPADVPDGVTVDHAAYQLIRLMAAQEKTLLQNPAWLPSLARKAALPPRDAAEVRTQLRALGLAYMAAAYSLVGNFNEDVLTRIALQQKQPTEKSIPIPQDMKKRILDMAAGKRGDMLAALSALTKNVAKTTAELLKDDAQTLKAVLDLEAEIVQQAAGILEKGAKGASTGLLVDRFYATGTWLIKEIAPQLANRNEMAFNQIVLQSHFNTQAVFTADMKKAGEAAMAASTLTSVKQFMGRYGAPLGAVIFFGILLVAMLLRKRPDHPFHNGRFVFFIFILIPVQTLFAHNWLTLPYYIDRAFAGTTVGQNFETFSNLNPILIFFLTPFVAALTVKVRVYTMMMWGTLVMAVPTFLLALPPSAPLLLLYILLMTIGEAMWQPRFLQWVAQIAPEGKTGAYMGIAQFPWFLTKVVTGFYSGYFLAKYCPLVGPQNPEMLWLIYGFIAMISPVALIAAQSWMSKGMAPKEVKN